MQKEAVWKAIEQKIRAEGRLKLAEQRLKRAKCDKLLVGCGLLIAIAVGSFVFFSLYFRLMPLA